MIPIKRQMDIIRLAIACLLGSLVSCVFLGYIYWPGKFSFDSLQQLRQGLGLEPLSDHHPVFMALLMSMCTHLPSSTFFYLMLQLTIVAICSSLGVCMLIHAFLPEHLSGRWRISLGFLISSALVLLPPGGILNVVIWKDVPFTWLIFLQACCMTLLVHRLNTGKQSRLAFHFLMVLIWVSGLVSMLFRHNAISVTIPIFLSSLIALIYMLRKRLIGTQMFLVWIAIPVMLACVYTAGTRIMKNMVTENRPANAQSMLRNKLFEPLINTDILHALYLGLPLEHSERALLQEFIEIDEAVKNVRLYNAQYPPQLKETAPGGYSAFIDLSFEILRNHPEYWILAKVSYLKAIINSRGGNQVPVGVYDDFSKENLPVQINMSKDLQFIRDSTRNLMGYDVGNVGAGIPWPAKLAFWTFYPAVFIQFILIWPTLLLLWFFGAKEAKSIIGQLLTFMVPMVASICLVLPMSLLSQSNDMRYFWAINLFSYVQGASMLSALVCTFSANKIDAGAEIWV